MSPVALDPEESVRAELDGATLYDVSYASAGGGRVSGWMVVPEASGPHPAIVYVHGSETDRDDFLDEAIAMANGGAVALTLNAPFARAGNDRTGTLGNYFTPGAEAALNQQMLDDVSAAFDLLSARPDVDPQRLAFVGHSWGASSAPCSPPAIRGASRTSSSPRGRAGPVSFGAARTTSPVSSRPWVMTAGRPTSPRWSRTTGPGGLNRRRRNLPSVRDAG